MTKTGPQHQRADSDDRTVGTLELFFDLVFVFAMMQVTHLMEENLSGGGLAQGALGLLAIWWAWTNYAWLTNTFEHADPPGRVLIFLAMAAMLVAATALPDAFGDSALEFAIAYAIVRVIHVVLLVRSARGDEELRDAALGLAPILLTGSGLIVVGAFLPSPQRELLWVASALIDFGGPLFTGLRGWRVSPRYFVERHGLIVIIALGESILSMGAGAAASLNRPLTAVAATMAVLVAAGMWWAYFEPSPRAEERLRRMDPAHRARHARDAYSYLHLLLVAGIVYFALGVQEALAHPDEPLAPLAGTVLVGGVALFFLGEVAYRWRDHHKLMLDRLVAGLAAAALIPLADRVPAVVVLGALLLICVLRTAWEIGSGNDPVRRRARRTTAREHR